MNKYGLKKNQKVSVQLLPPKIQKFKNCKKKLKNMSLKKVNFSKNYKISRMKLNNYKKKNNN